MDALAIQTSPEFEFIGGRICLDFANTVGGWRGKVSHEGLTSYLRLVSWSLHSHLMSQEQVTILLHKAESADAEATAVLERAYVLREAIYAIFAAIALGTRPGEKDLGMLNNELERGMVGVHVVITNDGFEWQWRVEEDALDQILGPLARSAANLLTSGELRSVRQCASENCGWLFVDTTKNHRRQWCSTSGCGNQARVRKYRQRQRGEAPSPSSQGRVQA